MRTEKAMHQPETHSAPRKRRKSFWSSRTTVALLSIAAIFVVTILALSYECDHSGKPGVRAPWHVATQGDEMIIQGPVDDDLLRAVEATLRASPAPITTVMLASPGGREEDARKIGAALAQLTPLRVVVPPGFACESACLLIALAAGPGFDPADNATLMFHRAWVTIGPQRCLVCQPPHWLINTVKDGILGGRSHREMQEWANALAPRLGDRLAVCKPNPFDTLTGITITGRSFKAFRAGDLRAVICAGGA